MQIRTIANAPRAQVTSFMISEEEVALLSCSVFVKYMSRPRRRWGRLKIAMPSKEGSVDTPDTIRTPPIAIGALLKPI